MGATILSGSRLAIQIRLGSARRVRELDDAFSLRPGLATILVGTDPASQSYVGAKQKAARELGFFSVQKDLASGVSERELLETISAFNQDPAIHGILVQLPLPRHLDENLIIHSVDPDRDVDGFHPVNLGKLLSG